MKNIIIVLVIVIILIVMVLICHNNTQQWKGNDEWSRMAKRVLDRIDRNKKYKLYTNSRGYRLGDMTNCVVARMAPRGEQYHYKKFPDSLASQYMRLSKKPYCYDIMAMLVKKYTQKNNIRIDKNSVVIHLRIGDVINKAPSVHEILSHQVRTRRSISFFPFRVTAPFNYVPPLKKIAKIIPRSDIKNITLMAGSHFDIDMTKSSHYISAVKLFLEDKGYNVKLRLGGDPDEDFVYACMSPHFVSPSDGKYALLITKVREHMRQY